MTDNRGRRFLRLPPARSLGAACAACLLVLSLGSCGDAATASTTRFTSRVYGYSLEHPREWSVIAADHAVLADEAPMTADGTVDILGGNADTRVSRMDRPGLLIAAQPVAPTMDAHTWAEEVQGRVSFQKGCLHADASEDITVDGTDAVLLTYQECPETNGYLHYWVAAVHNGQGFDIVWFDDVGRAAEDRPSLDQILRSFDFG